MTPETELERRLLAEPELRAGLAWGAPRWGHPEGSVGAHLEALVARIEPGDPLRADLRLIALVHDAFKSTVRPGERWSRDNDHATMARRFTERFTDEHRLLTTIELHDEPYWMWRNTGGAAGALAPVLARVPDVELFARFVELDASTEGKDLTFLWWFRRELAAAGLLPAHVIPPALGAADGEEVVYVKTFAVAPADQPALAAAARAVIAEHAARLAAEGEVLVSDDGLRVLLVWRWRGASTGRLLRDGDVVRAALAVHPALADAEAVDARVFRAAAGSPVIPTSA